MKLKLLIIGHTFPEPSTTGAGNRMMQLIELFIEFGYELFFATTAQVTERSEELHKHGVQVEGIQLNHNSFDAFISDLDPKVVLFDRFMTEEQFGWKVAEHCPNAVRILDTEDLHFLRKAREVAVKNSLPISEADLYTQTAKRELASILRCDLSLIISEYELALLQDTFGISPELLFYFPFISKVPPRITPDFEDRANFVTIGNLLHRPNVDSIMYLKKDIWPLIRKELPQAKLTIYGAYCPQIVKELHDMNEGFFIGGWVEHVSEVMKNAKVCLAPLRFGAGLKGKLLDAMYYGTPSVTTSIGAEGINKNLPFAGIIANSPTDFAAAVVLLYKQKSTWLNCQSNGFTIIGKRFQKELFANDLQIKIQVLSCSLEKHRRDHFLGEILQHQTLHSTKYMGKWIEEKNKKN